MEGKWYLFSLSGLKELFLTEPVAHVSYYEADAFARWKNCRLPRESEWEHYVCAQHYDTQDGNFCERNVFHPLPLRADDKAEQFIADLWEWTATPYGPYPGFKPLAGSLGEYNGKFMNNQMVMRGGCCVTPGDHIRATYRNFFQPEKRWQFSGIRLVMDVG